jgi:hypothetical protein
MTVKQLIESLSKIEDQEVRVVVRGYEGGYDDIVIGNGIEDNTPAPIDIALEVNTVWWMGRHEKAEDVYGVTNSRYQIVKAIIL